MGGSGSGRAGETAQSGWSCPKLESHESLFRVTSETRLSRLNRESRDSNLGQDQPDGALRQYLEGCCCRFKHSSDPGFNWHRRWFTVRTQFIAYYR